MHLRDLGIRKLRFLYFLYVVFIFPYLANANSHIVFDDNVETHIANKILTHEENAVLEKFFQVLIEESEAGYVLLGEKPLCIYRYYKDPFFRLEDLKYVLALSEGVKVWKNLFSPNESKKYVFM